MTTIDLHQVDVFTNRIFGGNSAAVVLNADEISDENMANIAMEMNLAETAFVLKSNIEADLRLRYFTQGRSEVKFCGHATIGTLYELARLGLYGMSKSGDYNLSIETGVGLIKMKVLKESEENIKIEFEAPEVSFVNYMNDYKLFSELIGIDQTLFDTTKPIMLDKNLNYIYLTVKSLNDLGQMKFDFAKISDNFRKDNIAVFCLIANEAFDPLNHVHVRGLAPLIGINEDPFTGSMQAGLATYLKQNNMIEDSIQDIRVEQGHFLGRKGFAEVSKRDLKWIIKGEAVHVFSTTIQI